MDQNRAGGSISQSKQTDLEISTLFLVAIDGILRELLGNGMDDIYKEMKNRNEIIPFKESTQFLGMTLDRRLNWEEHIKKLRAK